MSEALKTQKSCNKISWKEQEEKEIREK